MTITASCCHTVEDFDDLVHIATKSYSRDSSKEVLYASVCNKCYEMYKKEGLLLNSEKEELEWLS